MPTVKVRNLKNEEVGDLELSDAVLGAELIEPLIHAAVKAHLANARQGTVGTKTRGDVSGSGKKLWKQKGTGRARMGSIRSPLWRHGGTVHGPVPRSYDYKLPRKMQLGALRSALSAKLRDGELKIVRAFDLSDHKTKTAAAVLGRLEADRKVLIVDVPAPKGPDGQAPQFDLERKLALGTRNIEGVKAVPTRDV